MVLSGETELIPGTTQSDKETWRLYLRGHSNSQYKITVQLIGTGGTIGSGEVSLSANFATNLIFADNLGTLINDVTGYTVVESGGAGGTYGVADLATATDEYPGFYIEIQSTTAGLVHQFNMQASWDSSLAIALTATWVDKFSNANITDVNDNDMNRYLNWYYTDSEDNDPIYYDEGNILRISESNFKLQKELEGQIDSNDIQDKVYPSYRGKMWANPSQWLGYKNIQNHFGIFININ